MTELAPFIDSPVHSSRFRIGRRAAVNVLAIHTGEGSEDGAALGRFFASPAVAPNFASYHRWFDRLRGYRGVPFEHTAYATGGVNDRSRAFAVCGKGTRIDWPSYLDSPGGRLFTLDVAASALELGLPVRRLTPEQLRAGEAGLIAHADASAVYAASGGHTDPGPTFPWPAFLGAVSWLVAASRPSPPPEPAPVDPEPPQPPIPAVWTVAPGENLYRIAGKLGVALADLITVNALADPSRVFAGTRLAIPRRSVAVRRGLGLADAARRSSSVGGTVTVEQLAAANAGVALHPGTVLALP